MSIHRALQLNTAALALMGALFLGLAHASGVLPLLLAVAAIAAIVLEDSFPWLRLNRLVANIIALAAVAWSLRGFLDHASNEQLLAIANMLVYLQIVLLFQEKTSRVYWQLLVLSLLQVVVAAALSLGLYFAVLLGLYIVLALTTLVLLCIYRDLRRDVSPSVGHSVLPGASAAARRAPAWRTLLARPQAEFEGLTSHSATHALRPWTVLRLVAALSGSTLAFAAVFFYVTPRLSEGSWMGSRRRGHLQTGTAPEVRIEERGRIHLSNRVVLRTRFSNPRDGQPVPVVGEPYLHGFVLGRYVADEHGSRWQAVEPPNWNEPGWRRWPSLAPDSNRPPRVRQDVVLERLDAPAIYAMLPVQSIADTPHELHYHRGEHRIRRRPDPESTLVTNEYRYAYGTRGLRGGRQVPGLPHPLGLRSYAEAEYLEAQLNAVREFDPERFPRLAEIAVQAIRDAGAERGTPLDKAQALEQHFHTFDLYRYSLHLGFQRDERLDPIEDFVANHRTGHCEYFASALVLMLRSQGIPARMVVGYKGGDFNSLGRYYVVQERHAHAWVEAYMPPGVVSENEIAGSPSPSGTWYRLDPTPLSQEALAAADAETLGRRISQAFDYFELMWRDYVLSLTSGRQRESVFDPLTTSAGSLPWLETRWLQRRLRDWSKQMGFDIVPPTNREGRQVFQSWIIVSVSLLALGAIGLWRLVLLLGRHLKLARGNRPAADGQRRAPGFYLRLERLLARLPLRRAAGQTPRELALVAERRLAGGAARADVAHLPGEIVAAYYRVRFGGDRLDKNESQQIEQALEALVPAVSKAAVSQANKR